MCRGCTALCRGFALSLLREISKLGSDHTIWSLKKETWSSQPFLAVVDAAADSFPPVLSALTPSLKHQLLPVSESWILLVELFS